MGVTVLHNRYRLDEQLGEGGMGVVYRGQDMLLKRPVAVKILSHSNLGSTGKARLLIEAQSAARLNHPNIVTIYDAGETEDKIPFIVMELVPGQDLRKLTSNSLSEVVNVISQVCIALEHAHAAGIIHRDLKLENIIQTPSGIIKLMDFGLARASDDPHLTETGVFIGTFLSIAPELLMGQPASIQSDLYALGVMFYELACGKPPFQGDDPLALVSQHLHATPIPPSTFNPSIPPGVETLILRLLAKQPGDRLASAAEVRKALELVMAGGDVDEPRGMLLERVVLGRLVGRERELAEGLQLFHKAQLGESGILLISGEPGVGKSRLVRELAGQIKMARGFHLVGECYAEGGAPYAAFAQMILSTGVWPDDLSPLVLADLICLAPGLRVRYPEIPLNPPLDPKVEQQRLYESAFTFFAALAKRFPMLLVLEDVHWADGGTLALARWLTHRFRQSGTAVMMVLTFRDVEISDQKGINDLLTTWSRERVSTPVKLHRLDRQETSNMLETLFAEQVTAEFAASIYRETEGNPFFIEELCKALIEGGQIYRENGTWQRNYTQSIEMPRSIRMTIEARLNSLPAKSVEVLHLASVLGRRFDFDVLHASATEEDEETLISALEDAERAQLLSEVDSGGKHTGGITFEFAHAMIPTTLVEGLSGMRRRRLHRRVVSALERLRPEDYKTLAHHCLQASEEERALDFLMKAANSARSTFANNEAVTIYQQAVGLLNDLLHEHTLSDSLRSIALQLYENLGEVLLLTGQHEEAWNAFQNALKLSSPNDSIRCSRLLRRSAKSRETLRLYDETYALYREAESALGSPPSDGQPDQVAAYWDEWLTLQLDRIYLNYWVGNVKDMQNIVSTVLPVLHRYGTPLQNMRINYNIATMQLRTNRYVVYPETLEYAERAVREANDIVNLGEFGYAQFILGFCQLWDGDLDQAEKSLLASLQTTVQCGDVVLKSRCLTYLTVISRKRGDIANVRKYAALSLETANVAQMIEYISMAQANQAWVAIQEGDIQTAVHLAESSWKQYQDTMQAQAFCWVSVWPLLYLYLLQKEPSRAIDCTRLLLDPKGHPQPESIAKLLQSALQSWDQRDVDQAVAFLGQAADRARLLGYV